MTTIKSVSVGNGDMFYIIHGSDNFTQIDCNLGNDNADDIIADIKAAKRGKGISRFISTHPDQDHIAGLKQIDEEIGIDNFYCVKNDVPKDDETIDFKHYKKLRGRDKAYFISKGCKRRWMNDGNAERGSSGINIKWPKLSNSHFKDALDKANEGKGANNISPIITYSLNKGVDAMWMGDLEKDFLEKIEDYVEWEKQHILFVPHHGRKSGKVPNPILKTLDPDIIVIGEGPSEHLDYYKGYDTITQNSAKDIWFECTAGQIDVYVSSDTYTVDFLTDLNLPDEDDRYYLGSVEL